MNESDGLWMQCATALRTKVPEATWQLLFSGIVPLALDQQTLVLGVPDRLVREGVESRFLPLIEETLATEADQPLRVHLRILETGKKASAPTLAPGPATDDPLDPPRRSERPATPPLRSVPSHDEPRRPSAGALDSRFTFETFVTASSNRLAAAAAQAVAETPGRSYNPLYIYGDSGLGKTHLLHAIGNYVLEHFQRHRVLYLTTETFLNDLVEAIRSGTTNAFKRRYRDCDLLLIDDVQFMQDKVSLQEEFFHTYNDLYGAAKQIVLTSDRSPKSIETLEERLRSRFLSGLITKIDPPDLETRLAILRIKAEADHEDVPDDVLEFIATHIRDNIRELEGALIRVSAFASLNGERPSLDLAERVLSDIISTSEPRPITPQMILEASANAYGFSIEALCGPLRTRPLVTARQVAMYLVRNLTDYSYPAIGRVFGNRDHTTVIHAVEKISTQMKERRPIYEQVTDLIHQIKSGT